jgi:signal transduction histidine kinase
MDANSFFETEVDSSIAAPLAPNSGSAPRFIDRGLADRRGPLRVPVIGGLPFPAFCCDLAGAVVSHNVAATDLWGRVPDHAEARQWCGALALLDLDGNEVPRSEFPVARAVSGCFAENSEEYLIERPDGTRRRVEAHPKLAMGPGGQVAGAFCVLVDNTERSRLADELSRRDDEKDAFLAMLAHELRNPLAPILSAAHVMRRISEDGRICGMADVVERQVKQLSRFVSDLLDASSLSREGIELRPSDVPLAEVVARALDVLNPHAAARRQRVAVEFDDRGKTAHCDPERTAQAIANVLVNASSFTDEGGEISIRVRVDRELLDVEVEDNGIGIDPAEIGEIFKPYSHFATPAGRLRSGGGLGLALAKDICERHGGLISARSAGRGRGSRFRLILPVIRG